MKSRIGQFDILGIAENSRLDMNALERLLRQLPINLWTCDEKADYDLHPNTFATDRIEVTHSAYVVYLCPPKGKRLQGATVTNPDFPLRPDNIMDDQIGLRCCYHPFLESFGIPAYTREAIEIDIFKYPR